MSKEKQFKSVLAPYIQSFLEEYSQKGFKLESRKNNLVSMNIYTVSVGKPPLLVRRSIKTGLLLWKA